MVGNDPLLDDLTSSTGPIINPMSANSRFIPPSSSSYQQQFSSLKSYYKTIAFNTMNGFLQYIYSDKKTKYLFYFIVVNLIFMIVELAFGIWNNSLGLISDSAHMFFDCTALIIGLYGSIMSKWKSNAIYSYGYVRYEYVSGFINGILLIFISIYILIESVHRLLDPPIVHTKQLLLVSVVGFCINMYGVIYFHEQHHHSDHNHQTSDSQEAYSDSSDSECEHSQSSQHTHHHHHHHHDENIYGVYLHMLADALGSIGVIISTIIVQYFGWYIADPICSLMISILILVTSFPLIASSSRVLLQRTPSQYEQNINKCIEEILQIEGVIHVSNVHFWVLKSESNVGSLKVMINVQSNEQTILKQVNDIFRNANCQLKDLTIEIEKDPLQLLSENIISPRSSPPTSDNQ